MTYDPLGRQIRVDLPDGTFQTVFFDPWRSEVRDGADNVDGSAWHLARESTATPMPSAEDQRAATLSLAHAETPTITHLDALGRAIVTIEDLGDDATVQTTLTAEMVEGLGEERGAEIVGTIDEAMRALEELRKEILGGRG